MEEQEPGKIYQMKTQVTEETPVRIVFENGPYQAKKRKIGCFVISFGTAVTLIIGFAVIFRFLYNSISLWIWVLVGTAILWILSKLTRFMVVSAKGYKEFDEDKLTLEETIIIDLELQQAKRIEKLQSGKTKETEFDLKQVSRVVIWQGHGYLQVLNLEFSGDKLLQVGVAYKDSASYLPDALIAHGQKIGKSLNKPVILP